MAGLQVGQALGCSSCLGLASPFPAPHVPGHPTSICNKGVNKTKTRENNECKQYAMDAIKLS